MSAPTPVRLAVFPTIFGQDRWSVVGNHHMREVGAAWRAAGYVVRGLEPAELLDTPPAQLGLDLVHVNWTEGAAKHLSRTTPRAFRAVLRLPRLAEAFAARRTAARLAALRAAGIRVVYQVHDLASNWLPPGGPMARLDLGIKSALLRHADAWVVHENSCLAEPALRRPPARVARCPLGDYAQFHGPPVPAAEARARLGLPAGARVFLAAGYAHHRRDPRQLAAAFLRCAGPDWRLVLASMNLRAFFGDTPPDPRVLLLDGFIPEERYRDLFCAADWVVMDGARYLNSGVVRAALSYARPVLCRRFGAQSDMAAGAALWIDDAAPQPLEAALAAAGALPAARHAELCAAAAQRNRERTWEASHAAYRALVAALVPSSAAPAAPPPTDAAPAPVDLGPYLARPSEAEQELLRLHSPDAPLVIFDIGSCEGEDSIRYARRFPRARVFAFEPLPANQRIVAANLARYGAANVELVPLALSDRAGEAGFHVSSGRPPVAFAGADWNYGNKSSSLLAPAGDAPMFGWIEFKETISVRTDTLDAFCLARGVDRIDFVHMDVQGAEHLVLAGAAAMLPRIGAVWLEVSEQPLYAGQKLRREMEALLRAHGFVLGFASHRDIEGDQFYVNRRRPGLRRYLARRRLLAARHFAGNLKRRLLG